jgi:hypothetical protein
MLGGDSPYSSLAFPLNEGEQETMNLLFQLEFYCSPSLRGLGGVIKQLYKTYILSLRRINRNSGQKQKKYKKYQKSKFSSMLKN